VATEKDLHDAFLNFSVAYLNTASGEDVNEKIFESIAKVVLKMDPKESELPDLGEGSLAQKRLDELKSKGSKQ
jgi:hypothetical protein